VNVNPKPVEQKIDFECPRDVRIGFKNPPSGWQEGLGGGVGASVPFAEAVVLGSPQVLTCIYRQEDGNTMFFTLVQQAPNGYKCAVEKMSDKEKYNRFITCTLNTAPVIVPKKIN
jgi:hypothetical protein